MADALCGPSNALQNFQKHSTTDRTLQQERLISRGGPAQGFRSAAGQNAGVLDPEFEAFQAGQLQLSPSDPTNFRPQAFSPIPQHIQQQPSAAWTADFQRLNLSSPATPIQQQPFVPLYHPQLRHNVGGWDQEFALQQSQMANTPATQTQSRQYTPLYQNQMVSGIAGPSNFMGAFAEAQHEQISTEGQQTELFDEEAFTRAFEEASRIEEQMRQELEQTQADIQTDNVIPKEQTEEHLEMDVPQEQIRIGADLIHDPRDQEQQIREEQEDPNALAKTAAQLLDSVKDNQSEKFKNSNFLELMRQLRDREVKVEGDQIVYTDTADGEAIKEEIIELTRQLKKLALDRDRLPGGMISGLRYRDMYDVLIKLDKLHSQLTKNIINSTRVIRTVTALQNQPALKTVEPLLDQIKLTLANLVAVSEPETAQLPWRGDEIRSANEEITHLIENPLSMEEYFSLQEEFVRGGYNAFENLLLVERLLGYRINADFNRKPHKVHHERLRSVLSENIIALMDLCVDRGLNADQIPQSSVSMLVSKARTYGIDSPELKYVFREVENDIEDQRRMQIRAGLFPGAGLAKST